MFHVKHDPRIACEHYGADRDPDWRVEHAPRGGFWWFVTDWTDETVACGATDTLGAAVTEAVRWST